MSTLPVPLPFLILLSCFSFALAVFVLAALFRRAGGRKAGRALAVPPPLPAGGAWTVPDPAGPFPPPERRPAAVPLIPPAAPGVRCAWYRPLDFLWMGLVFLFFCNSSLGMAQADRGDQEIQLNVESLVLSIGIQLVLAGITVAVMSWRVHPSVWLGLRWRQWQWAFLLAPGSVLAMWLMMGGLYAAGYMEWLNRLGIGQGQDTVKLLQESKDSLALVLMSVAAVLVAPVCEEIVFRGYLYPAAKRFAGPWAAACCSSLVFAAAHGNVSSLLPLFFFALLLVVLYEKTGSIWAPMAAHGCLNGATVVIQLLVRSGLVPLDGA